MHLKQFRWKTVPNARTNGPCIGFPQDEHDLWTGANVRLDTIKRFQRRQKDLFQESDTYAVDKLAEVEEEGGGAWAEEFEFEEPECAEEKEATLIRRLESSE